MAVSTTFSRSLYIRACTRTHQAVYMLLSGTQQNRVLCRKRSDCPIYTFWCNSSFGFDNPQFISACECINITFLEIAVCKAKGIPGSKL